MYLRDHAIVLAKEPFREHDRWYVLYGREYGLLKAVARGASSARSKQVGHLEPFSCVQVMIAKGKAFDKIAVARMAGGEARFIGKTLGAHVVMGAVSSLVASLVRPGIPDDRLFEVLQDCRGMCAALTQEPTVARGRFLYASAALRFLDALGYAPSLESAGISSTAQTIVKAIRHFPLVDVVRMTAPVAAIAEVCDFCEKALEQAPLYAPPHGLRSIQCYLAMT